MLKYEVVESKHWLHTSGATASIYGAHPSTSSADDANWQIVSRGFTIRNNITGTVGIGRLPFATREGAQAWIDSRPAPSRQATV